MTTHQSGRHASGGQVAPRVMLGVFGFTAGIMAATSMLQQPARAAQAAPGQASFMPPAPQPPALPMPTVHTPSVSGGGLLPMARRGGQVSSRRMRDGCFYFDGAVNGTTIRMMFDTGASFVSLTSDDATRAGIAVNGLSYNRTTKTANGTAEVAPVVLDSLTVGDITRYKVRALVSRPGRLSTSLLGQSFMVTLKGYRLEGDEVILQGD